MKELLRDMITIVKQDGKRFENVRALVQRGKIITDQIKIPIEPGDHVIRKTRAGVEESFIVDDPGFLEGGKLSHYEMKVRKTGEPVSPDPKPMIYYNVTGANTNRVSPFQSKKMNGRQWARGYGSTSMNFPVWPFFPLTAEYTDNHHTKPSRKKSTML